MLGVYTSYRLRIHVNALKFSALLSNLNSACNLHIILLVPLLYICVFLLYTRVFAS
jgi:hypothetical protein